MSTFNMNHIVGNMDIVLVTFDTLRYDVAQQYFEQGKTPNIANYLPREGWEKRHSPGTFTFPSHSAFFAGFLPNPGNSSKHERLFASTFMGSETTGPNTFVFEEPNIVKALFNRGYETICIGGVGFFNKLNEMGMVFPGMFNQSFWNPSLGVTNPDSAFEQFNLAEKVISEIPKDKKIFLFINLSALHQPNFFYCKNRTREQGDDIESHGAALEYIDKQWPVLMSIFRNRNKSFHIYCSDHGTCYGEDGFYGHRIAHPHVLNVPYSHFIFDSTNS